MTDDDIPSKNEIKKAMNELTQDELDDVFSDGEIEELSSKVFQLIKTASKPSIALIVLADLLTNLSAALKDDEAAPIELFRMLANTIEADIELHGKINRERLN